MKNEKHASQNKILPIILFGLIACVLYGLAAGTRSDIGILLKPLAAHSGLSYDQVSFCIAVMELVFGLSQPLFGMLAAKKTNRYVLNLGAVLLPLSFAGMFIARSELVLLLSLGIIFGSGAGALAFGSILTSAIHFVGRQNAMLISGMLNASAGMVGFILLPVLVALLGHGGLSLALFVLSILAIGLIPITRIVIKKTKKLFSRNHVLKPKGPVPSFVRQSKTVLIVCRWLAFLPAVFT